MCIAVVQNTGHTIPEDILTRCFTGNRDGAGFAYLKNGKVVIDKGYMKLPDFLNHYKQLIENKYHENGPMLVHCRIATIGKVHPDNCHPFRLRNGALIHNGSLWWDDYCKGKDAEKSDTRIFSERLHNALNYDDIVVDKTGLERAIIGDKMAMLFDNGKFVILNEERGVWQDGVWYSHRGPLSSFNNWRDAD